MEPGTASGSDLLITASEAELVRALVTDDEERAALAADTLWRATGSLAPVYRVVSEQLAAAGAGWSAGYTSLAVAHRLTLAAQRLIARLRPLPPATTRGTVLLTSPPDDRHTLGLFALGHLLEDRGHRAVVGGNLPWEDLGELAAEEDDLVALCVSLHSDVGVATVRRGIAQVRKANEHVHVLVGGPRVEADPSLAKRLGADASASSIEDGLRILTGWTSRLSAREGQVLECVATGMTNGEAAQALGLSTETVKSHLDHIYIKTGTTHRAAAVATALRSGWLT